MLIRLAVFVLEHSPLLRRLLWRWWYGRLASKHQSGDWTFMNYGFAPPDGATLALDPADESDRYCIQLYHRVASAADLAGREVLEVGSGRGGGASYIARNLRPAKITGADFSPQAVALCQKRHATVANLAFTVGDAEQLPFPAASFDAVVNVESSHCYGHIERFFAEAARVLRPGGHFLYTDFRPASEVAAGMPRWPPSRAGHKSSTKTSPPPWPTPCRPTTRASGSSSPSSSRPPSTTSSANSPAWSAARCMRASGNGKSCTIALRSGK